VLHHALQSTVRGLRQIRFIVDAAFVLSKRFPCRRGRAITQFLVGLSSSRLEFFGALFGSTPCPAGMVESSAMIVVTVPLFIPVMHAI